MRSSLYILVVTLSFTPACSSDDPTFPDGGINGGSDAANTAEACSMTPYGSCRSTDGLACAEYAGAIPQQEAMAQCGNFGDTTWSDAPCERTGSVGGCQMGTASPQGAWCTTIWWYPPATTEASMAACGAAGTWLPGA